jgi:beta-galactosidase
MGFNALSVYIMWNYHEVSRGKFDYSTENKNLSRFLALAKQYQFYVLIRPGPYVCAEWDFGGLPARLLNPSAKVEIRQNDPGFLAETRIYFQSLVSILQSNLASRGGPIIMLQIEN